MLEVAAIQIDPAQGPGLVAKVRQLDAQPLALRSCRRRLRAGQSSTTPASATPSNN